MLSYHYEKPTGTPVIFLHGLLGSSADWQPVFRLLQKHSQLRPIAIDLPCHGQSHHCRCVDFNEARQQLHATFQHLIADEPFWLVGYSLGGRLALDYCLNQQNPSLLGTILEGTNIGLTTEKERQARWQNDHRWAKRFRHEPIQEVLQDWYLQPIFAHLTEAQRHRLIVERQQQNGSLIAQMLEATSLAKQPNYRGNRWENRHFLIGEKDQKFRQLANETGLPHQLIANAGHNAHRENPVDFCKQLIHIITRKENGTSSLS